MAIGTGGKGDDVGPDRQLSDAKKIQTVFGDSNGVRGGRSWLDQKPVRRRLLLLHGPHCAWLKLILDQFFDGKGPSPFVVGYVCPTNAICNLWGSLPRSYAVLPDAVFGRGYH